MFNVKLIKLVFFFFWLFCCIFDYICILVYNLFFCNSDYPTFHKFRYKLSKQRSFNIDVFCTSKVLIFTVVISILNNLMRFSKCPYSELMSQYTHCSHPSDFQHLPVPPRFKCLHVSLLWYHYLPGFPCV